ncbi:MAG: guanylate kinase [Porphyromonadaceae bacterium]|nr:guanylate kinase [Porphyromonadaceae bacterium]
MLENKGKVIIFSAPSGSGKSTIVNYLLKQNLGLEFSISATTRLPRGCEKNGIEYYFLSVEDFKEKIENNEFIEYEEVYSECYYGTLRNELDRISTKGNVVIFDVDVLGGINLKKHFGESALSIFIAPPSIESLRKRLVNRCTDSKEMIEKRVGKAEYEMTFASQFDKIIVNDNLEKAKSEAVKTIKEFLNLN